MVAIAGFVILLVLTDIIAHPEYFIYGITLVLLYLMSTLYHSISHVRTKDIFRRLDHMAIYLLIAGTYTPFCLNALDGWIRWTLLAIVWGCAVAGIVVKFFFVGKF